MSGRVHVDDLVHKVADLVYIMGVALVALHVKHLDDDTFLNPLTNQIEVRVGGNGLRNFEYYNAFGLSTAMALTNGLQWLLYYELDYCNRAGVSAAINPEPKDHARAWGRKRHKDQSWCVGLNLLAAVLSFPSRLSREVPFWVVAALWFTPYVWVHFGAFARIAKSAIDKKATPKEAGAGAGAGTGTGADGTDAGAGSVTNPAGRRPSSQRPDWLTQAQRQQADEKKAQFDQFYRATDIPLDVHYVMHRCGEWTMLMVGEGVLSMLAAPFGGNRYYYLCFAFAFITCGMLQYLYFDTQEMEQSRHAYSRSKKASFVWVTVLFYHSATLVVLGVSMKIFVMKPDYPYVKLVYARMLVMAHVCQYLLVQFLATLHVGGFWQKAGNALTSRARRVLSAAKLATVVATCVLPSVAVTVPGMKHWHVMLVVMLITMAQCVLQHKDSALTRREEEAGEVGPSDGHGGGGDGGGGGAEEMAPAKSISLHLAEEGGGGGVGVDQMTSRQIKQQQGEGVSAVALASPDKAVI